MSGLQHRRDNTKPDRVMCLIRTAHLVLQELVHVAHQLAEHHAYLTHRHLTHTPLTHLVLQELFHVPNQAGVLVQYTPPVQHAGVGR